MKHNFKQLMNGKISQQKDISIIYLDNCVNIH